MLSAITATTRGDVSVGFIEVKRRSTLRFGV